MRQHGHPSGARTRPTLPTDARSSRALARLDLATGTPGWTLAGEHDDDGATLRALAAERSRRAAA